MGIKCCYKSTLSVDTNTELNDNNINLYKTKIKKKKVNSNIVSSYFKNYALLLGAEIIISNVYFSY